MWTKIRVRRRRVPFGRPFSKGFLGVVLAAALFLVSIKLWDMPSGLGFAGHPLPGLKEMAAKAGQGVLEHIWDRFYPAPAMDGEGKGQIAKEADPSYRAAKTVEAFFQEHSYLALYGNEETGGLGGEELWQPGLKLAEGGSGAGVSDGGGQDRAGEVGVGQDPSAQVDVGPEPMGTGAEAGPGEDGSSQAVLQDKVLANRTSFPGQTYQLAQLEDYDFLMSHFYSVHTSTTASRELMDAKKLLRYDLRISGSDGQEEGGDRQGGGEEGPQILIYHTHSQEAFADSGEGETIVGAGTYLAQLLEAQGFSVYHDCSVYDVRDGKLDRNKAYTYALEGVEKILAEHPSIQVVIDLHRDGVRSETHLITEVNGKPTAQIMFFNGLSQTPDGPVPYLENPYREENLAFSLQLQLKAQAYYPGFTRKIYLKGLRYNLHLRPRSCLVEAGAQTNTYEEILNAMEPLAEVFTMVLRGK